MGNVISFFLGALCGGIIVVFSIACSECNDVDKLAEEERERE